ncbi:MAG TPA: hypothetical protein VJ343_03545, partial [archaeon]|nr:hypothetical protein [archaeon]
MVNFKKIVMKFLKFLEGIVCSFIFLIFLSSYANAYPIFATTDKITYAVNDALTVSGTVETSSQVTVSSSVYDYNGSLIDSFSATSSGGSPNTFSVSSSINDSYSAGNYVLTVSSGSTSVNLSFKVILKSIELETYFIKSSDDIINVSTTTLVTSANEETFVSGGNLSELVSISLSGTLHYGSYYISGKTYHFVLVDQTNTSVYDRLYVDDDPRFQFYNDTEDSGASPDVEYQALKKGSIFSNKTFKYIVGEIERFTGNKVILFTLAAGKPPYSTSDTVNFIVIAKNSTHLLSNQVISIDIRNSTGNVTETSEHTTNSFGWFAASKTLSNVSAGFYILNLNESLGILPFPVESFKLFFNTADQSDNPTSSFAPNSIIRFLVTSISSTGLPINLTSFTIVAYAPIGQVINFTKSEFTQIADGIYRLDSDSAGAPTGRYSAVITGSDGTNTQTTSISFEIQSVNFVAEAVNPRYMDEAQSSGAMVNAFPPAFNVTIITFLSNISAGGMQAKGSEGPTGLVAPGDCNSSLKLISLKDENGASYSVSYLAMNLSYAINNYFGANPSEMPPEQMLQQCM